jgi:hypothetical protein
MCSSAQRVSSQAPSPTRRATNVARDRDTTGQNIRIPALAELPMMSVVQPAYHCEPKGGHGSFLPSASRRFSCVLVLATVASSSRITVSLFLPSYTAACVPPVPQRLGPPSWTAPDRGRETGESGGSEVHGWRGRQGRTLCRICDCYQQKVSQSVTQIIRK